MKQQLIPKKEEPIDPFLADLEKVDPRYAQSLKSVYEQAAMTKTLHNELRRMQEQQFAKEAYSHFDGLLSSNKVTDDLDKDLYKSAVEAEVFRRESRGDKLGLKDLDSIFNTFHTKYTKAIEDRNRKLTASYIKDKTKDAPLKGATGGAPAGTPSKKLAAGDFSGQAKWLADQIRSMKKEH